MLENNVFVIPSQKCNLNCTFCFINNQKTLLSELPYNSRSENWVMNQLYWIIEENSKKSIITNIILFGGEPLLDYNYNFMYRVLSLLKNFHSDMWKVSVFTNLCLEDAVLKLKSLMEFNVGFISCSYDTVGRFTNKVQKELFIKNAKTLSKLKLKYKIISVLTKNFNEKDLLSIIKKCKPSAIELEPYTENSHIVNYGYTCELLKKYCIDNNIEIVTDEAHENGIACYRGHCSGITILAEYGKVIMSCCKSLNKSRKELADSIGSEYWFVRNHPLTKNMPLSCITCNHYNSGKCSAFCTSLGCILGKSINK